MSTTAAARAVVMTGASSGIGREAVLSLLAGPTRPARLVVGARTPQSLAHWLAPRAAAAGVPLTVLPIDLASLATVRDFADSALRAIAADGVVRVTYLGNAGSQSAGQDRRTHDGYEETFAVNALAHVALVWGLWPTLGDGGRVVLTASGTHHPEDRGARIFGFRGGRYSSARALARGEVEPGTSAEQAARDRYATSKLALLLFVRALARRAPQMTALGYDPGFVPGTGLARDRVGLEWFVWRHVLPLAARLMPGASTPARSGATLAWLAAEAPWPSGANVTADRKLEPAWSGASRDDWVDDLWQGATALLADVGVRPPR